MVTAIAFRLRPSSDRIGALGTSVELVDDDIEMARERAAAVARYDGIRS